MQMNTINIQLPYLLKYRMKIFSIIYHLKKTQEELTIMRKVKMCSAYIARIFLNMADRDGGSAYMHSCLTFR